MKKTTKIENKITKNMSFSEIMEKHPEAAETLFESGMHCFGCAMASSETLEQGCIAHGLDPNKIIEKINLKLNKKTKKK